MFKFLQILVVINLALGSAQEQGFSFRRSPDKIGNVLEEDYAAKVTIQNRYNLGSDYHMDFELPSRYDYHVSIIQDGIHQCSGAVVQIDSTNVVVAPANCVDGKNNLLIRLGSPKREIGGTTIEVKKVVIHEKYINEWHINDVAVLFPRSTITIRSPLTLATNADTAIGTTVNITGWPTMYGEKDNNLLLYSVFKIVPNSECHPTYANYMLCAGERKKNASYCHYTTGSPLVANGKLFGFSMWDKGCRRDIAPSVYLSVPAVANWIQETVRRN